jgi:hypothetical protein
MASLFIYDLVSILAWSHFRHDDSLDGLGVVAAQLLK